jgi:hypothetical protein
MLLNKGDYSSSYKRFDFQVSIGKRGLAYLTASMFDVVNKENHDDPEQKYGQVTARREVRYLQDKVPVGQSQEQSKSSNTLTKRKNREEKKRRRRPYSLVDRLAVLAGVSAPGAPAVDGLGLLGGGAAQADDGVGHQRKRDHGEDEYQEHGVVLLRGRHGCRSRAARGVLRAAVGSRIRRRGCRRWGGGRRIWARRDGMVKEREARRGAVEWG